MPAPSFRRLTVLRGRLDELLTSPAYRDHTDDYLSVTLTDPGRPENAIDRLRGRFPYVLVLGWEPDGDTDDSRSYRARVAGRDDLTVAAEFVEHVTRVPATVGERSLLATAFEAARRVADADPTANPDPPGIADPAGADLLGGPALLGGTDPTTFGHVARGVA